MDEDYEDDASPKPAKAEDLDCTDDNKVLIHVHVNTLAHMHQGIQCTCVAHASHMGSPRGGREGRSCYGSSVLECGTSTDGCSTFVSQLWPR